MRDLRIARRAYYCPGCGQSAVSAETVVATGCAACLAVTEHLLDGMVRLGDYQGPYGLLLIDFKFRGVSLAGRLLGRQLANRVMQTVWFPTLDAITVVPTHWRHRLQSRQYAAEEIADIVATAAGVPLKKWLYRTRAGARQVGSTYAQRQRNVLGLYKVKKRSSVKGATILLIDDVRTTGATLLQCAKVLKRAGAKRVFGAVVAHRGMATMQQDGVSPTVLQNGA